MRNGIKQYLQIDIWLQDEIKLRDDDYSKDDNDEY